METIEKAFGERVRNLRKQKKLSQEELAEKSHLHPTYIGQIERAEKSATIDTVSKIAIGLGIPISTLFEKIDDRDNNESSIALKCYEIVSSVSSEKQEQLLEMIQRIEEYGKRK